MNGVTILNEYFTKSYFPGWCVIIISILLVICLLTTSIGIEERNNYFWVGLCCGVGFAVFLVYGWYVSEQPSSIKEYQVIISDNVSMIEFMEKYEIINVEGKIYTVREK